MIQEDQNTVRLALRRRAMDLLARREHTRHELSKKLSAAFQRSEQEICPEVLTEVLDKLEQDKLLSDSRFTESYVNGRMSRGYGPLYIRHKLREKQVDGALLDHNLDQLDQEQWIEQLSALIRRRMGDAGLPAWGSKEHAKLQRFILSRGFTSAQWREVEKRFKSP
ncbi:MAG: regulatory protein RecX [Pseudohongiella sp.]|nr:regulatory protein RecX [Pseudohongiella sp.]